MARGQELRAWQEQKWERWERGGKAANAQGFPGKDDQDAAGFWQGYESVMVTTKAVLIGYAEW